MIIYELTKSKTLINCWNVEGIDHDDDGACYVTIFVGAKAKQRAETYRDWRNAVENVKDSISKGEMEIKNAYNK